MVLDFRRNNLDGETSPYLHQHRDNPVHWQPWRRDVLQYAREQNRPILLSVGYAACHWCHVMAHESFENEEIAGVMNDLFVNIKVDREERPDIDAIYQSALQLLGQQGGWPLTMFLTSDGEPFWGGTYFPSAPKFGRPGFTEVLNVVETTYRNQPERVEHNRAALAEALANLSTGQGEGDIPHDIVDTTARRLLEIVDMRFGGLGEAPKFPHVADLDLLLRAWRREGEGAFMRAVEVSADAMARGGIYDHLGGGWARYSVDRYWLVPHFEKMLYDNALLIDFYTRLWLLTRKDLYRRRVDETVAWLQSEMITGEGAFCSSLDADSLNAEGHGEEGAFYVWTESEIDTILGEDSSFFKEFHDVRPHGNWEGKTILNSLVREPDAAGEIRLAPLRRRLLDQRAARPRPGLDDKVLADWNGLMIRALARAGAAFGRAEWISMARRAFDHVSGAMASGDRLGHSARAGTTLAVAMIDDYSHMADAALSLHDVTGEGAFLERARAWVRVADRFYRDSGGGGYFFTADDADALIVRTKTAIDNATPSGNGTMVGVLARLWHLTGETEYRERAEEVVAAFARDVARNPAGHAVMILNLDLLLRALDITIIGTRGEAATDSLIATVWTSAHTHVVLRVITPGESLPATHPAAGKGAVDGRATAYVCRGQTCSLPVTDVESLAQLLHQP
ncbi:MAG: thioredoxin domain-containing protein [bacterium]|nr:thioredoxin domain-containing protein [bacterium]